jgi:NAD(P)H-dependent FMN reductase
MPTEGKSRRLAASRGAHAVLPARKCERNSRDRHKSSSNAHTKRWAESVKSADAYVFVTPEYNYSPSPSLVNALDYVYVEWNYKPAGFVSYGGVSGGLRAVQTVKLQATTLKLVTPPEGVPIPNVTQFIDKDKNFSSAGGYAAVRSGSG